VSVEVEVRLSATTWGHHSSTQCGVINTMWGHHSSTQCGVINTMWGHRSSTQCGVINTMWGKVHRPNLVMMTFHISLLMRTR